MHISFSMTGSDAPERFNGGNTANNGTYAIQHSFLKSNQSEGEIFHTYDKRISSIFFSQVKMGIVFSGDHI